MKFLFLGFCLFIVLLGENVFAQNHKIENNKFIEQLSDIAMQSMEGFSDYGHKLIEVEEIGNISHTSNQNKIEITACRFNDLNQKKEIENHPEKKISRNDFFVCDVCQITLNKTENNTYKAVEMSCVLHDSRAYFPAPEPSPVGGYNEINADTENIKQLALFSLDSITQQTMSKRSLGLIRVVSAKSQVVAGINYKIKLLVCEKDSKKDKDIVMDHKNCRSCDVTIWEQSWLDNKNVTKVACSKPSELNSFSNVAVTKRDIHENVNLGAKIHLSTDDKKVKDIVDYALLSIDKQEGSNKPHILSKIINVSKQIVSGVIYNIELEICENSTGEVDKKKCRICNIKVWEQAWENNKNTLKFNCYTPNKTNIDTSSSKTLIAKKNDDRLRLKTDFENFITTHNKMYSSLEEKNRRFRIFAANMKKVQLLQKHEQGSAIYGATQFADLTKTEFKKKYLGLDLSLSNKNTLPMAVIPQSISIPNEFDWRDHNAVTPVKNQGACGSCWAFSAIANIEGQYALKSKTLLSLSEQELVDCDNLDNGCGGGLMTQAFEAIENLGGLETESDYPYEGHADRKGCQLKKGEVKVSISKAVNVSTDEEDIAKFLVKHGPLSVGVNANAMQFYMGGVSHPIHALCSSKSLDHGVAIVGYGVHRTKYTHKNLPYWLIKNSWGPGWGEKGYYLLYRGDGSCGVNQMVSSAIIE
ncbi:cathepsin F-like isoform X4 [Rhopalosiphum padi]|uniref:cathepsin F-like isoform X4 n=2 Tax=Rhopalosiphum padi TaxID=40932 RepID=UPI00298E55B0|nr:cathepsin F-like isoform X4 [Rhopalosiphum padi]